MCMLVTHIYTHSHCYAYISVVMLFFLQLLLLLFLLFSCWLIKEVHSWETLAASQRKQTSTTVSLALMSADGKQLLTTASLPGWRAASSADSALTSATEFWETSATDKLSIESSDISAMTVWLTVPAPPPTAGVSHELSVSVTSRRGSEFTRNSSDLVLRSRGRLAGDGPVSAVSLSAGDGTPTPADVVAASGVVLTGGVATRPDGDGVDSINYKHNIN